jgi:hypothetical protein
MFSAWVDGGRVGKRERVRGRGRARQRGRGEEAGAAALTRCPGWHHGTRGTLGSGRPLCARPLGSSFPRAGTREREGPEQVRLLAARRSARSCLRPPRPRRPGTCEAPHPVVQGVTGSLTRRSAAGKHPQGSTMDGGAGERSREQGAAAPARADGGCSPDAHATARRPPRRHPHPASAELQGSRRGQEVQFC